MTRKNPSEPGDQHEPQFNPFSVQLYQNCVSCFVIDSGSNAYLYDIRVLVISADISLIILHASDRW
jgi:hypothetical protein